MQLYDNGVAGIHIMGGSNNFTFEATVDSIGDEGEGNVGSLDGQQPIEIIIETSADVKFTDMRVQSLNGKARLLCVNRLLSRLSSLFLQLLRAVRTARGTLIVVPKGFPWDSAA